jgi:hypothetical protein
MLVFFLGILTLFASLCTGILGAAFVGQVHRVRLLLLWLVLMTLSFVLAQFAFLLISAFGCAPAMG